MYYYDYFARTSGIVFFFWAKRAKDSKTPDLLESLLAKPNMSHMLNVHKLAPVNLSKSQHDPMLVQNFNLR